MSKHKGPRVLFIDIETKPLLAYVWQLYDQNVAINQIQTDWSILSFSAKWLGDPASKTIYQDVSKQKDIDNDRPLLGAIWKLLDAADVVVAQNGLAFDKKKIYARLALLGMQPPSNFQFVDTLMIARKTFSFTSNKLEYLSDKLNKKYKKLKHKEFAGFEMWKECIAGNKKAWKAMRKYNMYDVLALEELYEILRTWDSTAINFSHYTSGDDHVCGCGSKDFEKRGYHYTMTGKFQRYRCHDCGTWTRDRVNLLSKEKRAKLHLGIPR